MKIFVTADLHYNIPRCREPVRRLAQRVLDEAQDGSATLVILGDIAGADLGPFVECLKLFDGFTGRKFIVPGNHCLWCRDREDSLHRYQKVLPGVAAQTGFELLDHQPVVLNGLALVGSMGWYDYSFRDKSLGIPLAFYRAKVSPGAAVMLGGHEQLLAGCPSKLSERSLSIAARWMDGVHVKLPVSDEQFSEQLAEKMAAQLVDVSARADRIVAMLHHLPFEELVPQGRPDRFAFASAYMGSSRLGQVLLACQKVTEVFCGHSHWPRRQRIGHIDAINVGSTYKEKRLEILHL